MHVPRRVGFLPAFAICLVALTLGACGVKGELERPPAAKLAASEPAASGEAVASQEEAVDSQEKVFTTQSRVERIGRPPIIPTLPPKEWSKNRDSETNAKSSGPRPSAKKSSAPDKPFVLDWLL